MRLASRASATFEMLVLYNNCIETMPEALEGRVTPNLNHLRQQRCNRWFLYEIKLSGVVFIPPLQVLGRLRRGTKSS